LLWITDIKLGNKLKQQKQQKRTFWEQSVSDVNVDVIDYTKQMWLHELKITRHNGQNLLQSWNNGEWSQKFSNVGSNLITRRDPGRS
jgi:hypothetical protein